VVEHLTAREAADILGKDLGATMRFLGRHQVPRYVRWDDLLLAKAAAGQGRRHDQCVAGREHLWETGGPRGGRGRRANAAREEHVTGEPVWCRRKGCPMGVILNDYGTVIYRRRRI
jgi:hypothetical protein